MFPKGATEVYFILMVMTFWKQLLTSEVSRYQHPAVATQFFETAVRYDKFFSCEPEFVPSVLVRNYDTSICVNAIVFASIIYRKNSLSIICAEACNSWKESGGPTIYYPSTLVQSWHHKRGKQQEWSFVKANVLRQNTDWNLVCLCIERTIQHWGISMSVTFC